MFTIEVRDGQKELKNAAVAAEEIGIEHPECPEHGVMWYDEGESEVDGWHGQSYVVNPSFYCPQCSHRIVIS